MGVGGVGGWDEWGVGGVGGKVIDGRGKAEERTDRKVRGANCNYSAMTTLFRFVNSLIFFSLPGPISTIREANASP